MMYGTWQEVVDALLKQNPQEPGFYIITRGKGTDNEERTRFMTHAEALGLAFYEAEKEKINATR